MDYVACTKGNSPFLLHEFVGVPAIDLGGPRRQFFTEFLQKMPEQLKLVEKSGCLCFLTCLTDCLLNEHYTLFAKVIVHSVFQEGPAFPYFPQSYYLVGGMKMAVEHLCIDELPLAAKNVVEEVSYFCNFHGERIKRLYQINRANAL